LDLEQAMIHRAACLGAVWAKPINWAANYCAIKEEVVILKNFISASKSQQHQH